MEFESYLRVEILPTAFCPGCGNGIVANAFFAAVRELGYEDLKGFAFVSGIGCSSWIISPYFKADTIHTLHGRAIPVAFGLKLARPDLKVVVIAGDGDLMGIGMSHVVHAARRNVDMLVVLVNNFNYGMTGGQVAPTTPIGARTTTTPYGNVEEPVNACKLLYAAGAVYVARWTTYHVVNLKNSFKKALQMKGFKFVEVLSQCPTVYGRRNNMPRGVDIMKWYKEVSIPAKSADELLNGAPGKIVVGEVLGPQREEFVEKVYKQIASVRGELDIDSL